MLVGNGGTGDDERECSSCDEDEVCRPNRGPLPTAAATAADEDDDEKRMSGMLFLPRKPAALVAKVESEPLDDECDGWL